MSGADLKRRVLRKHRGKTAKEAFLAEFEKTDDPDERVELAKASPHGEVEKVDFEVEAEGSVGTLWKNDDDFVIWGPASVEVVDKENDRIKASALKEALPQLMKRQSLSYEHSDQIVGEILSKFKTEEPREVQIRDKSFERQEFPTDVLKFDDMEPALFVAGNVYNDTKKARDVREGIEKGDIRSYSISGEAIVTSMSVEGGAPVTDISKLDLSAVTLCNEGMNQLAKFGVVKKSADGSATDTPLSPSTAASLLKNRTMSNGESEPLTKSGMEDVLDKHLPDGELATKADVESIAKKKAEQVVKENATNTGSDTEGTPERPTGEDSNPVEQDSQYEGDAPDETASDSDKVEEKSAGLTMKELEEHLPSDQFKAIKPVLQEKMDDPEEMVVEEDPVEEEPAPEPEPEPEPEPSLDEVAPEEEEEEEPMLAEEKAKSMGLDPQTLSDDQMQAIAKADVSNLKKASGATPPAGADQSPALGSTDEVEDIAKSTDGVTLAGSNFFDENGKPKL